MRVSVLQIAVFLAIVGITVLAWYFWYHDCWFYPIRNKHGSISGDDCFGRVISVVHGVILLIIVLGPCGLADWMDRTEVKLPIRNRYDN